MTKQELDILKAEFDKAYNEYFDAVESGYESEQHFYSAMPISKETGERHTAAWLKFDEVRKRYLQAEKEYEEQNEQD